MIKDGEVICELEGHYESYRGINNTQYKQEESSLQGGSDRLKILNGLLAKTNHGNIMKPFIYRGCVYHIFLFLGFFNKTAEPCHIRALKGQSYKWLSDAIKQTHSTRTFLMQSGVPNCRISPDCVLCIYNGVNSEAALTSMVISVAGSHLLLYS